MEFKKNDYVTVTIEDIGTDGEGIGKVDGFTLFIKDAVIVVLKDLQGNYYEPMYFPVPNYF